MGHRTSCHRRGGSTRLCQGDFLASMTMRSGYPSSLTSTCLLQGGAKGGCRSRTAVPSTQCETLPKACRSEATPSATPAPAFRTGSPTRNAGPSSVQAASATATAVSEEQQIDDQVGDRTSDHVDRQPLLPTPAAVSRAVLHRRTPPAFGAGPSRPHWYYGPRARSDHVSFVTSTTGRGSSGRGRELMDPAGNQSVDGPSEQPPRALETPVLEADRLLRGEIRRSCAIFWV